MKQQYTPGPWKIDRISERGRFKDQMMVSGECWREFALVYVRLSGRTEDNAIGLANARLIAAAPDLLEALKKAEGVMQILLREYQEEWESDEPAPECVNAVFANMGCVQSAIEKAEGRSE